MCCFERLYKNRYLIAVYDRDDEWCYGVFDNIEQLSKFTDTKSMKFIISRAMRAYKRVPASVSLGGYNYCFIDIFEKHNDCFADEDKQILEYYEKTRYYTIAEYAEKIGVSARTFARNLEKYNKGEDCKYEREIERYYDRNELEC